MDVIQGHTVTIEHLADNMEGNHYRYKVKCLSCSFEEYLETKELAEFRRGYHFGRVSTKVWPYGSFLNEIDVPVPSKKYKRAPSILCR